MRLKLGRVFIFAHINGQDENNWPPTQLGLGYFCHGFISRVYRSKTVYSGPEFNLYIYFGKRYLCLTVEWLTYKEPTFHNK